jgi:hypothetical protein
MENHLQQESKPESKLARVLVAFSLFFLNGCNWDFSELEFQKQISRVTINTNWAPKNAFDFELEDATLPRPTITEAKIKKNRLILDGKVGMKKGDELNLVIRFHCNKNTECLGKTSGKSSILVMKKKAKVKRLDLVVFIDDKRYGVLPNMSWNAFKGVVVRDSKGKVRTPGFYMTGLNIKLRTRLFLEPISTNSRVKKLNLSMPDNEGIESGFSNSVTVQLHEL